MEKIKSCPICGSNKNKLFLSCEDYTVSHETFEIKECEECSFKFTSPRPALEDLGKYYKSEDYVSHSDSKKGIVNSVYHYVRQYTLLKKLKLILRYSKPGNILDYGCGTGSFLEVCKKAKWNVYGIEPDVDARTIAKTRIDIEPSSNQEDLTTAHSNIKFNIITLWHVLEHIPDLESYFNFINNHLAERGTVIIAVPNCNSYDAKKFGKHWAAYDVPRHLWHFTPNTISKLFSNHGFKKVETLPMIFDSFYVSMLSNKYVNGNTKLLSSFITGLKSNIKANKDLSSFSSQIYIFKKY